MFSARIVIGSPVEHAENTVIAACQGFQTFRVERKVVEDAAKSACSFYLMREDGQPLLRCRRR